MLARFHKVLSKFLALFKRSRLEGEFDAEIDEHVASLTKEFERRGLQPEEARYAARRQFGGVAQLKELQRESRSFRQIETLGRDIRHALSSIRKNPVFSIAIVAHARLGHWREFRNFYSGESNASTIAACQRPAATLSVELSRQFYWWILPPVQEHVFVSGIRGATQQRTKRLYRHCSALSGHDSHSRRARHCWLRLGYMVLWPSLLHEEG